MSWSPRYHHGLAFVISLGLLVSLIASAGDIGFARDEGFYNRAARGYQRWFDELVEDPSSALTQERVDRHWSYNHEHPALMKTLFGFSRRVVHEQLGWLRPSTALRLPGMLMAAFCVYLVILWGCRLYGPLAGVTAGLLLAAQPRFFYHAHLACFDVPVVAVWLATVYAYWRARRSKGWAVVAGIAFGLCLCTKLNAFFIPPMLIAHHVAMLWWERRRGDRSRPLIPASLCWMAIIGPVIFFCHWPWIWFESLERVGFYLGFHQNHPHYNMEYFGTTYFRAPTPMTFPFVMTALTLPVTTLLLCLVGLVLRVRAALSKRNNEHEATSGRARAERANPPGTDLLLVLCLIWPMAIIAWPTVPIFGGTKHWLPALPFVALLAGAGVAWVVRVLKRSVGNRTKPWVRSLLTAALCGLLVCPALRETWASHPYGLTHYNVLIGGPAGAADAGLNRQYWGYTTGSLLDWLNEHVPPNGSVFFHDTAHDAFTMYREDGTLRGDIRWGRTESARYSIVHHEQHMAHVEYEIWERISESVPVYVLMHEGVPVISVYERRTSRRP